MKKRILTVVIAIAILAGIAVPVRAEETVPEEAVECLTEMPYEALPEEEFEFDEDKQNDYCVYRNICGCYYTAYDWWCAGRKYFL